VKQSRHPKLGDLLVVTPDDRVRWSSGYHGRVYTGVIYEIRLDKWGHQNNVFVAWQGGRPPSYSCQHGYCGTNIHNLRSEFEVIRNGVQIP